MWTGPVVPLMMDSCIVLTPSHGTPGTWVAPMSHTLVPPLAMNSMPAGAVVLALSPTAITMLDGSTHFAGAERSSLRDEMSLPDCSWTPQSKWPSVAMAVDLPADRATVFFTASALFGIFTGWQISFLIEEPLRVTLVDPFELALSFSKVLWITPRSSNGLSELPLLLSFSGAGVPVLLRAGEPATRSVEQLLAAMAMEPTAQV